ncbi:hypothetical protein PHISCL_04070 [Aspergillus sclerotialis]|uniref:Uncharacterized protein n=1 Tax=Aspergillus sclerotialis TaxID=2070753 RepID=A0A3A2ZWC9_9EURO|nr:hypothetical protein PHISCL_04070 [Aspergillus sclerotialis]
MLSLTLVALSFLRLAQSKPVSKSDSSPTHSTTTSDQWLIIDGTSVFWPTSTDYFYGPTKGPKASVVTCNAEWIEYRGRDIALIDFGPTSTSTYIGSYAVSEGACRTSTDLESYSDTHTGPVTTLCDGIPRALGPRETVTKYFPGTGPCVSSMSTFTNFDDVYREPTYTPTCSLNTKVCIPVWSTYESLSSKYTSAHPDPPEGDTASPIRPWSCPRQTIIDPCTACHWNAEAATVFYWPVTTADGDLCKQNGTTVPPSGPSTVIVDGQILTSPSIYISFDTISAWGNNRVGPASQCGDTHTSTMIAVEPDHLTSMRNHHNGKYPGIGTAYPFNFGDFQPHEVGNYTMSLVPWDVYQGGYQCQGGWKCTMIRDDYYPWLQLPEEVRAIDPKWTACHRSWNLPSATMIALGRNTQLTKTKHAHSHTHSATPQSPVVPPTPTATGDHP